MFEARGSSEFELPTGNTNNYSDDDVVVLIVDIKRAFFYAPSQNPIFVN